MPEALSTGKTGYGSFLEIGDAARATATTWTELAQVSEIGGIERTQETTDKTHFRSPGGYREYAKHLRDGGEPSMTIHYDPTDPTYALLKAAYESDDAVAFRLHYSGFDDGHEFDALVISLSTSVPLDDLMTCSVTLRITGPVVDVDFSTP